MRATPAVLTLLLGAALGACNGADDLAAETDTDAATLSEAGPAADETSPEPPDEATPPEPPIPPEETPPDVGPPDMRPDPLPPGEAPPEGTPPDSPPPPTIVRQDRTASWT